MAVRLRERKGKWWVYIYRNGKEKAKCVGADKQRAEAIAAKIQAKLTLGELGILDPSEKRRRPFDAYFRNWLATYVRAHCKDSTFAGYEGAFRLYLLPRFGQTDLSEIPRDEVKQLAYDMLAQGKSRSYVKATLAPLSEMFNHAIEDGHFTAVNPALRVLRRNRGEEGARQEKTDFLTHEDAALLLDTCQEHSPGWYPFVLCLTLTGVRIGEAVALQWGDIDFAGRFATVKRNIVDGKITTTKSGKSRQIDLSARLTETLKALEIERKKETLRRRWKEQPPWVFINERGNPVDPDNFRKRVWPRLLARAGLRHIRIHGLRHTYASMLIQQEESLTYVKEQLGHHSIRVTVDTYGHLVPGGNKAAVDRLDALLNRTKPDPRRTSKQATR